MKLKDFTVKTKRSNSFKSTQYILGNHKYEKSLNDEIENLRMELSKYSLIQKQRDDSVSQLTLEKAKATEARTLYDKTKEENLFLLKDISFFREKMKYKEKTDIEIKEVSARFSDLNNKHTLLISQKAKINNELDMIKKQRDSLVSENKQYNKISVQAEADKFSAEEERNTVLIENIQLRNTDAELSIINNKTKEENKTLRDEVNIHRKEAEERLIALDESKALENKLRIWINNLEDTSSKTEGKNMSLDNKVENFEKTVKDMATTIDQIVEENSYIRDLNKQYRLELSKPRYISMATISRKEKLNMPTETVFRRSVGNAPQPLIKFKQEKKDDN